MIGSRRVLVAMLLGSLCPAWAHAQGERRLFAGVLAGVSAISADSRAVTSPPSADVSLYTPGNGPALNVFAGVHLGSYFALQGNYVWNRNDLTLVSASTTGQSGVAYTQERRSRQHAVVADALVYFRNRDSRIRPYLGTGLAVVHFASSETSVSASGLTPPPPELSKTGLALRSHVGIDVALSRSTSFRYSFSETIGGNPISPQLTPPGERGLANFQNLFGVLARF